MRSSILFIVLLFFCNYSVFASDKNLCVGENATFSCLKEKFTELYSKDYAQFWNILHNAAKKFQSHDKLSHVATFMELAPTIQGNAEVSEFFGEICEKFFVVNTEICLDALITLDKKSKHSFIDRLRQPIYLSKTEIYKAFLKYKDVEKYKDIIEHYFETK